MKKFKNKTKEREPKMINLGKVSDLRSIISHFDDDSDVIISSDDVTDVTCVEPSNTCGNEYLNAVNNSDLMMLKYSDTAFTNDNINDYCAMVSAQVEGVDSGDIIPDNSCIDSGIMNFLNDQFNYIKHNVANYIDTKNGRNYVEMARLAKKDK